MSRNAASAILITTSLLIGVAPVALAQHAGNAAASEAARDTSQYNLGSKDLALEGYDPVAYFDEGGAKPRKGKKNITATHRGVTYRFASDDNRETFRSDPSKYEPAYGGWCAWAMAQGEQAEINPKTFRIQNDRLLVFYNAFFNDTSKDWDENPQQLESAADEHWQTLSGERPMSLAATPVKAELDAYRIRFLQRADQETIDTYEKGIDDVAADAVMQTALKVGDKAPDFTLPNAVGESVALSSLLERGPVVITWYRGGWCPYCNIQLKGFQEVLPELTEAGAQLVAISPETPDNSLDTKQKNELAFHVLSDANNSVARSFGVAYTLPNAVAENFKTKFDLPNWNGSGNWDLPLSVTYVIDQSSTVRYAYVDADYRNRAEPSEAVAAVREITGR